MQRNRGILLLSIGALIGAALVPLGATGTASAATLAPSGLTTGMQIDGDKSGGTPPGTFDWDSFLSPPVPDGSFTFTPTGPYTTTQGYASTGILDATFDWDNGTLAAACSGVDATGSPGSQTPNTNPWAPGPANVNDKDNICSSAAAYEIVTDAEGVQHAILYTYWTRFTGNGDMSTIQLLEGPLAGRCDDVLVDFDYDSSAASLAVSFRRWTPTAGDDCANPNGAGEWLLTGEPVDFDWSTGIRTEGPPLDNQPQTTFGEFAVDLTTAGLFSPESCSAFTASTMLSRTGNDFTAQTEDYLTPGDPLTIANCGTLTVTKQVEPAGYQGADRFDYLVNRAGGGIVLPDTDATQIDDDLGIGETDVWENVLQGTDYRLSETVASPWALQSIVCTVTAPGTETPIVFMLDDPADTFTVFPETTTDCVITNATSTVTVTKQTLPDGSPTEFAFEVGANAVALSDGESATFSFAPGTTVDISETIPAGWVAAADITCTDANAVIGGTSAQVTTVAGEDVSCVFTNTQLSTIVISKEAFGTPDDSVFEFTGDWTTGTPALGPDGEFSINVATGDGTNYTQTFEGVLPGTYTVSEEPGQNGTLFGSLLCTIGGTDVDFDDPTAQFTLAPGDTVTCYFVNVTPGQILVVKETDPFEYDQDFPFEFGPAGADPTQTFTLNPLPGQATFSSGPVGPGQYDITELIGDVPNWALTGIVCDVPGGSYTSDLAAGTATVDLPPDGAAECIFTNTADRAQVTVAKSATGIADDYPWSFEFQLINEDTDEVRTLTVDSENPIGTLGDVLPGADYTLIEVAQAGWSGTLSCDPNIPDADATAAGWQFSVPPAFDLQCTATNTATPATVSVEKTVTDVTPGYEWSFDFTLDPSDGVTPGATQTIDGTGPGTGSATWEGLLPGETYTLTEEAVPGWMPGTLTCAGVEDLDPSADVVEFVATPGLALSCTITNTPEPIDLEIVKTALGGDATFQWVLTPLDPVGPAIVATVATEGGTGTATLTGLVAGTTYSLDELDFEGWIEGELECTVTHADGSAEPIDVSGFTVEPGDQIACTIENQAVGTIVIVKNVEGPDGTFDFTGTWLDPADFSITTSAGTGSATFPNVIPGSYQVSETDPVGFDNTLLICDDGDPRAPRRRSRTSSARSSSTRARRWSAPSRTRSGDRSSSTRRRSRPDPRRSSTSSGAPTVRRSRWPTRPRRTRPGSFLRESTACPRRASCPAGSSPASTASARRASLSSRERR